ncbi:MAG TPA: peptidoglycan DD-metalloendopeptidase family protein [Bacilli bacterium]
MRKIFLPFVILSLLVTILGPQQGSSLTKLQQAANELKQAEAKQKRAEQNLKKAQAQIRSIQLQKKQTTKAVHSLQNEIKSLNNAIYSIDQEIITIDKEILSLEIETNSLEIEILSLEVEILSIAEQIENTNKELKSLEHQSDQVEAEQVESKRQLQEAIQRIEARSSLLRGRLRLMYTNGAVTYLEVLMGSTDFTDFLVRFDFIKGLVNHDKEILDSNKRDYTVVTGKLAEIKVQLAQLVDLHRQQVATKDKQVKARNKQVAARDKQIVMKNRQVAAKNQQVAAKQKHLAAKSKQVTSKNRLATLKKTKEVQIANLNKEEQSLAHYTEQQEREMIKAAAQVAASKKSIAYYKKGSKLGYPLGKTYRISSGFGTRTNPITGKKGTMHKGMDFAAPGGTSILAAESGRVLTAGWLGGYGNTVILDHGNGLWTLYAHGRTGGIKVKVGQTVKRGQKVSEVGTTGSSTGNHLHFEVRLKEKAVDPRNYLSL